MSKRYLLELLLLPALAGVLPALAQTVDPTFAPTSVFAPGQVFSAVEQPDGKRVAVGSFTRANGVTVSNISRFNANGSLDAVFQQNVGTTNVGAPLRIRRLPNGQFMLNANNINSGLLTAGGITRREPLRLNADGTGDATFDVGIGAQPSMGATLWRVSDMLLLPNGQTIVVGVFGSFNNAPYNGIARLSATGAVDLTFNSGQGPTANNANAEITTVVAQPDGKFIIGGPFTNYNGNASNGLARLNADGSFDPSFQSPLGANSRVVNAVLQTDGKILITGTLNNVPNTSALARLLPTGAYDTGFTPPGTLSVNGTNSITGEAIQVQPDGKVLVINGSTISRLNPNGTLDGLFQATPGITTRANSLTLLTSGQVTVGGFFPFLDRTLVQLTTTGALDPTFAPNVQIRGVVNAVVRQNDGKLLVGGNFSEINGQPAHRLARFLANGTLDGTFAPGFLLGNPVVDLALQPDGRLLAATATVLRRFQPSGALDNNLTPPDFGQSGINRLLLQPDGRLLVGRIQPSTAGGVLLPQLVVRLQPDGTPDNSFAMNTTGTGRVTFYQTIALQPDGKVLVAGTYLPVGSTTPVQTIVRLESTGTVDASFTGAPFAGTFPNFGFRTLLVQPDGKILVGGSFTSYGGVARTGVARLNPTGALDAGFVPPAIAGQVNTLLLQPNNRVLLGGLFSSPSLPDNLARLLSTGTADASFAATAVPNSTVFALLVQPDGAIMVGGFFTAVGNQPAIGLTRLTATNVLAVQAPGAVAARTGAWPVPAHSTLNVAPDASAHAQYLDLLDALGRPVLHQALNGSAPAQVAVGALPAGTYLLRVTYVEGTVTRRVQVQ